MKNNEIMRYSSCETNDAIYCQMSETFVESIVRVDLGEIGPLEPNLSKSSEIIVDIYK